MSYRTTVNNTQIFGNNESYKEWLDFIKTQGIKVDEEGLYEGEIKDVMGMFDTVDKITRKMIDEAHARVMNGETDWMGRPYTELADLSNSIYLDKSTPILVFDEMMINNAYIFMPYTLYKAVEDCIELTREMFVKDGVKWFFCSYKIKEGETIRVNAG